MSNYRVRQVLALGPMRERQLRFLLALATWMDDDTRTVTVGFVAVIAATGNSHNTVRKARQELEKDGRVSSLTSRGRGHLAVWTVHCLPEKGTNGVGPFSPTAKGTNGVGPFSSGEKVPTGPEKRYQAQSADQAERVEGLNLMAKPSLSARVLELLATVDPAVTEREADSIATKIKGNGGKDVIAILRAKIRDGDASALIEETRADLSADSGPKVATGRHSSACRAAGHDDCAMNWCECRCHRRTP
ncbi:MAG: hypothetical protein ACLP52_13065 [Streptosporangiaceae bacterium]